MFSLAHDNSVGKTVGLTTSYIPLPHGFELCLRHASKTIERTSPAGCGGFTEYCPGFPPAEDSRPKCVFKSLELLDLTSILEVIPAHMCFTHDNKSMQSEKK